MFSVILEHSQARYGLRLPLEVGLGLALRHKPSMAQPNFFINYA